MNKKKHNEKNRAYEWLSELERIFNDEMPIISKLYWFSDLDDDVGLNNIDSQLVSLFEK
jgi:hypothetical protein